MERTQPSKDRETEGESGMNGASRLGVSKSPLYVRQKDCGEGRAKVESDERKGKGIKYEVPDLNGEKGWLWRQGFNKE